VSEAPRRWGLHKEDEMDPDESRLDGNAVAGELGSIFAVDLLTATGECAGCGRHQAVAALHAYTRAPGIVLRCPTCQTVQLRLVQTETRSWFELRGMRSIEIRH
jgi:hypothetical protein